MTKPVGAANPDPGELADEGDARDWDVEQHGRMREHATDEEPPTIPWTG